MVEQVYRGRKPKASPRWQCLSHHFDEFLEAYEERYQPRYGFLRPIIPEVVEKFLECGDLARGFARIRCDHCKEDRLLAFSCKGRWFCPSCHQKKVQLFGALLAESILYPVPHRHFVFGIPKMLRRYFRYDRDLLNDLCRVAHECLTEFLRTSLGLPEGVPGIVMAIHNLCEAGSTRASTSTADAGCSPASARTWNGSPNTSSATPFRSKRCGRPSRARLRHPDRSSTAPA